MRYFFFLSICHTHICCSTSVIQTHTSSNGSFPPTPAAQIDVYRRLGASLNIAFLYGAFEDANAVRLVMERCSGGALWDRLKERGGTEGDAAVIMREVLRVIAQCHAKDVVLRDVKYVDVGLCVDRRALQGATTRCAYQLSSHVPTPCRAQV